MSAKSNSPSNSGQTSGGGPTGQPTKLNSKDSSSNVTKTSTSKVTLRERDKTLLERKGYTIGNELGRGTFSVVCKANKEGKPMAVKIIEIAKTSVDYKEKFLPRELKAMWKFCKEQNHPNIIKVYDIFQIKNLSNEKPIMYVFMDVAEGGDVLDLIKEPLSEPAAKPLYKGIANAISFIHKEGFAHRDLKCENILLNRDRTVAKIADFGFAKACFQPQTGQRLLSNTFCGSAAYAAPEILSQKSYDGMVSDVWSIGVVLYVIVNCRLPFHGNIKEALKQQIQKNIEFKSTLSETCKDLIRHQLDPVTTERFTIKQVLGHKWLN